MRRVVATLLVFVAGCIGGVQAQEFPGARFSITQAEIRAMAYTACTEARGEPRFAEELVAYVIYRRGLENRSDFGRWNLVGVVRHPGQFEGLTKGRCPPEAMRRSLALANHVVDGWFFPGPYRDAQYFVNPCGGTAWRTMVYLGTPPGSRHEFYRERRRGEPPRRGPGCRHVAYRR